MEGIKASRSYLLAVLGILVGVVLIASPAVAAKKPNILVIWGDDIGLSNLGVYNHGDEMPYSEHRQHRQRWRSVYRPLRPAILHRRAAAFIIGQYPIRRIKPLGPGVAVYP
jgi:hypothetical protein